MLTTAVRPLGEQLMSRFFVLPMADDREQIAQSLAAQAETELGQCRKPAPALAAYQALLQREAPWKVVVPFASALAQLIGKGANAPRILRDFQRLLSLVKAVAILRHPSRSSDERGRLWRRWKTTPPCTSLLRRCTRRARRGLPRTFVEQSQR